MIFSFFRRCSWLDHDYGEIQVELKKKRRVLWMTCVFWWCEDQHKVTPQGVAERSLPVTSKQKSPPPELGHFVKTNKKSAEIWQPRRRRKCTNRTHFGWAAPRLWQRSGQTDGRTDDRWLKDNKHHVQRASAAPWHLLAQRNPGANLQLQKREMAISRQPHSDPRLKTTK